jgi:hypothetical protein
MKKIALLLLLFSVKSGLSQCCPYMGSIITNPQSPAYSDVVYIITQATTPNQATEISQTFTVNGTTIDLQTCYYMDLTTALSFFIDTFNVGQLNPGTYSVNFRASISSSQTACVVTASNSATHTFVVSAPPDGIQKHAGINGLSVYPNPVKNRLSINFPGIYNQELKLSISNTLGQTVFFLNAIGLNHEIDLDQLPEGIYLLYIRSLDKQNMLKLVKE